MNNISHILDYSELAPKGKHSGKKCRIANQHWTDESAKSHSKGKKARNTKQYWAGETARARRKQGKVRYDTHRRDEQPNEQDEELENIHFANFLGDKTSKKGIAYNNNNEFFGPLNINMCDKYMYSANEAEEEVVESVAECRNGFVPGHCRCGLVCRIDHNEPCAYFEKHGRCMYGETCIFSHPIQEKKEEVEYDSDCEWEKFEIRFFYDAETKTLSGTGYIKRLRRPTNDDDEPEPRKRGRFV